MTNEQILKQLSLIPNDAYKAAALGVSFEGEIIYTGNGLIGFLDVEKVHNINSSRYSVRIYFLNFYLCFSLPNGPWELFMP